MAKYDYLYPVAIENLDHHHSPERECAECGVELLRLIEEIEPGFTAAFGREMVATLYFHERLVAHAEHAKNMMLLAHRYNRLNK